MGELSETYKQAHRVNIQLNFASSGTLARQIEHGAAPDIYISANEKWVDYLIRVDKLESRSKKKLSANSLALIVPVESHIDTLSFQNNLPGKFKGRLAMGDPKHVPAGEYAMQAIHEAGYNIELKDRILPAKDVRSALMVVELGEVELGIVYLTDALKSKKVKLVAEVPPHLYAPISFFAALLKKHNNDQSIAFYEYLSSPEAKGIWIKHGFKIE